MNSQRTTRQTIKWILAGVTSTYVMSKFQTFARRSEERLSSEGESGFQKQEARHLGLKNSATVKLADRVSMKVSNRSVSAKNRRKASALVHYGFGATMGIIYGLLNAKRRARLISGPCFGTAVWAMGDAGLVPLMKLSPNPAREKPKTHAYALGAHLVFGVCLQALFQITENRSENI